MNKKLYSINFFFFFFLPPQLYFHAINRALNESWLEVFGECIAPVSWCAEEKHVLGAPGHCFRSSPFHLLPKSSFSLWIIIFYQQSNVVIHTFETWLYRTMSVFFVSKKMSCHCLFSSFLGSQENVKGDMQTFIRVLWIESVCKKMKKKNINFELNSLEMNRLHVISTKWCGKFNDDYHRNTVIGFLVR